jgi:uncharacterized membrane protein (UPF0182 family)
LYTFPKDRLVYGPMQIESRIDQNPEISQALTLWSQRGSKVVRGNLLVIPIERSLLYVEPLYLLAERSELPELRRVLVAFGDSVAMEDTLEEALKAVFAAASGTVRKAEYAEDVKAREGVEPAIEGVVTGVGDPDSDVDVTVQALVKDAVKAYEEADEYLSKGDFARFGESLATLGRLLEELKERTE